MTEPKTILELWDDQINQFITRFRGRPDVSAWEFDCKIGPKKRRAISDTLRTILTDEGVFWNTEKLQKTFKLTISLPLGKDEDSSIVSSVDMRDIIRESVAYRCSAEEKDYDEHIAILKSYIRDIERAKKEMCKPRKDA
jgi:hypothetical protein